MYVINTLNPLDFFFTNFLFDFENNFSILDAGMYKRYANNAPTRNEPITSKKLLITSPIAVKLSRNL